MKRTKTHPLAIDPFDDAFHDKILYVIYGNAYCFPNFLVCTVTDCGEFGPTIWGYSTYQNDPKFRTLGQNLNTWISENCNDIQLFFDNQDAMLNCLKDLTTLPKKLSSRYQ